MAPVHLYMSPAAALPLENAAGAVAAVIGGVSFWLTVALAAAGSVLSAMCIADPVSHPKDDSYYFVGQWFVWLATPLLWGTVVAALAFEETKALDLVAVILIIGVCRWASRALCDRKWRSGAWRTPGFLLP